MEGYQVKRKMYLASSNDTTGRSRLIDVVVGTHFLKHVVAAGKAGTAMCWLFQCLFHDLSYAWAANSWIQRNASQCLPPGRSMHPTG